MTQRCFLCSTPIVHAINARGETLVVNEAPDPEGNLVLQSVNGENFVTPRSLMPNADKFYRSHISTCAKSKNKRHHVTVNNR